MTSTPLGDVRKNPDKVAAELVAASARRAVDPFTAIPWNDPDFAVDPTDPRWVPAVPDASRGSAWLSSLEDDDRARYSVERICAFLLVGIEFERGLCQGLQAMATAEHPGGARSLYAYEEIVEETKHSLMFTRFIAQAAPWMLERRPDDVVGEPVALGQRVADLYSASPILFLLAVLCGEEPIDHVQRSYLLLDEDKTHPLLRQVCAIHVSEEARHLRFARTELRVRLEEADTRERARARLFLPQALDRMTRSMISMPDWMAERWSIPLEERRGIEWTARDRELRGRAGSRVLAFARQVGIA